MNRFTLLVLFWGCFTSQILLFSPHSTFAQYNHAMEANELEEALLFAKNTRMSGDPKLFSQALVRLSAFRNQQVVQYLFEALESEIKRPAPLLPRVPFMLPVINALQIVANSSHVAKFDKIRDLAETILPGRIGAGAEQSVLIELKSARTTIASNRHAVQARDMRVSDHDQLRSTSVEDIIIKGIRSIVTDEVASKLHRGEMPLIGSDGVVSKMENVLARVKGKAPALTGDAGVGKTTEVEILAQEIVNGTLPEGIIRKTLEKAMIISTTGAHLDAMGEGKVRAEIALLAFLKAIKTAEKELKRPILLFIDDAHKLSDEMRLVIQPYLESADGISFIFAATSKDLSLSFGSDEKFIGKLEQILVEEPTDEKTISILKTSWLPLLEQKYQVSIGDRLLRILVEMAKELKPMVSQPSSSFAILQDFLVSVNRAMSGEKTEATSDQFYAFAAKQLGMPAVPQDEEKYLDYMEGLKADLKKTVLHQDAAIDQIIEQFENSQATKKGKKHSVVMAMGSTGVGKSFLGATLGEKYYRSKSRFLELDMTAYKDGKASMNLLVGAANGYLSSDKYKGKLCEFLDKLSGRGGIIVMNEIEKAHSDIILKLMEVFDKGEVTCGDSVTRKLGRTLILLTSNKGATKVFSSEFLKTATDEEIKKRVSQLNQEELKKYFKEDYTSTATTEDGSKGNPPEVWERIDSYVYFKPLSTNEAKDIAKLNVKKWVDSKQSTYGISVNVSDAFSERLIDVIYDQNLGARQVVRNVEKYLERLYKQHVRKFKTGAQHLDIGVDETNFFSKNLIFRMKDDKKQETTAAGPALLQKSVFSDPETLERLKHMEESLNELVLDQKNAVKRISQIAKAKAVGKSQGGSANAFLIGLTGTGKTELAKALAKIRYGREDALKRFDMGEISSVADLYKIFPAPLTYKNSDEISPIEQFIIDHPDGGVFLYDEMSNAGGKNKELKEEIAKFFYSILDEGKFTTPRGKTYDTSKFFFLFTGNDGEKEFAGVTSDDRLEAIWRALTADPKTVNELLSQSGFPPAFLGRIIDVILMKPLTSETKRKIAQKFLSDFESLFKDEPFQVQFSQNFATKLAQLVFDPSKGARSIRNFINSYLKSAIVDAGMNLNPEQLAAEKAKIELNINDISPEMPFFWLKPDQTKAALEVKAIQNKNTVYEAEMDFTADAKFIKQIRKIDAFATAYHEAGHAILNDPYLSGHTLEYVTIVPADKYLGYARYENIPNFLTNHTEKTLIAAIAIDLGGSEAEDIVGRDANTGKSDDLKAVRKKILTYAIRGGLEPRLYNVRYEEGKEIVLNNEQNKIFDEYFDRIVSESRAYARKYLIENFVVLKRVKALLMRNGSMTGKEVAKIVNDWKKLSPEEKVKINARNGYEVTQKAFSRLSNRCNELLQKEVNW